MKHMLKYHLNRRMLSILPVASRLPSITAMRHLQGKPALEVVTIHDTRELAKELVARMSESEITSTLRLLRTTHIDSRTREITIKRAARKSREHGYDWFYKWLSNAWAGDVAPFPLTVPGRKVIHIAEESLLNAVKTLNRYKTTKFLKSLVDSSDDGSVSLEAEDKQMRKELIQKCRQVPPSVCKEVSSLTKKLVNEEITENEFVKTLKKTCRPHSDIVMPLLLALGQPVAPSLTRWVDRGHKERQETTAVISALLQALIDQQAQRQSEATDEEGEEEDEQEDGHDSGGDGEIHAHDDHHGEQVGKGSAAIKDLLSGLGKDRSSPQSHTVAKASSSSSSSSKLPKARVTPLHCASLTFRCVPVASAENDEFSSVSDYSQSGSDATARVGASDPSAERSSPSKSSISQPPSSQQQQQQHQQQQYDSPATVVDILGEGSIWSSPRKVFIENIPDGLDEDGIKEALRTCGKVEAIKLFDISSVQSIYDEILHQSEDKHDRDDVTTADGKTTKSSTAKAKKSEGGKKSSSSSAAGEDGAGEETVVKVEQKQSARAASTGAAGASSIYMEEEDPSAVEANLRLNPLAMVAASQKKRLKKGVIRAVRSDNCAFVMMADEEGYARLTREDVRIFGICMKGNNCRVQPVNRLRTLVVELKQCLDAKQIHELFTYIIGPSYQVVLPEALHEFTMPVFVTLEFPSHEHAWHVHEAFAHFMEDPVVPDGILSGPITFTRRRKQVRDPYAPPFDSSSPLLGVTWIRSKWFWTVTNKGKEINLDREATSDFAVLSAAAAADSNEEEKVAARNIVDSPRFRLKPKVAGMPEEFDDSVSANDSISLDDLLDVDMDSGSTCL